METELDTFLRQLCAEVHSRLMEIRRRGKSITLKFMVRAQNAPVETAKFMGHGVCDHITKTTTLNEPTDDLGIIERTIFSIKTSLNVQPQELRGIGIQINKLDGAEVPKDNALKAMFAKVIEKNQTKSTAEPEEANPAVKNLNLRSGRVCTYTAPPMRGRKRTGRGGSIQNVSNMLVKISEKDQLDMAVLAELPDDIQAEILRDQKLKNGNNKRKATKKQVPKPQPQPPPSVLFKGVDNDFLAALPTDIRDEIIREQTKLHLKEIASIQKSPNAVNNTGLEPKLEPVKPPLLPAVSEANVFVKPNWRVILQSWLDSTTDENEPPLDCDVDIFAEYAIELIRAHLLSELYLCFRFFYR